MVEVLKGIDFAIKKGDFLIIFGPSGCGKSTLLHSLLGLEKPSTGETKVFDKDLYNCSQDEIANIRKQYIGMVYQQANWIKSLRVAENVRFPLLLLGKNRDEADKVARQCLEKVGMINWADYFPMELSSGQQQKVSLARALINDPEVIVADEPTGNLDTSSGEELMKLLTELNKKGKTIVMVTHDLEYLVYGTRIIHMIDGVIDHEYKGGLKSGELKKLTSNGKKYHQGKID